MIIFDLDDTLIDTSGTVTPFKMRECLKRLIQDGAMVGNFEEAYAELMALNSALFPVERRDPPFREKSRMFGYLASSYGTDRAAACRIYRSRLLRMQKKF